MRFFHTGDIRLGAMPEADKPWSRDRARDIRETFTDILIAAREARADLLLIAGNLFPGQPTNADLREINALFLAVPDLRIVLAAGSLDRVTDSSAIAAFTFAPNVTVFRSPEDGPAVFPEIHTAVFGAGVREGMPLPAFPPEPPSSPEGAPVRIFLGSVSGEPETAGSTWSYAALAGSTSPRVLAPGSVVYAGSPEPLSAEDQGARGYYTGIINEETGLLTSLEFVPAAKASYIPLTFRVTPKTTAQELEQVIDREIRTRGASNLYLLKITGRRHPDEEFLYEPLRLRFRIADLEDLSEPEYDFGQLFSEHPADMIGFYIRAMRRPDMSPVQKKALYYGIRALLLTAGERS